MNLIRLYFLFMFMLSASYASAQCDLRIKSGGEEAGSFCVPNPGAIYYYRVSRQPYTANQGIPPHITYRVYGGSIVSVNGDLITPVDTWNEDISFSNYSSGGQYPEVGVQWNSGNGYHAISASATRVGSFFGLCGPRDAYADINVAPVLPNVITVTKLPTCTSGEFSFRVPAQDGVNYQWSFPFGWQGWGSTAGAWVNQISGTANNNGNAGSINGGIVRLTMTTVCGVSKTISLNVTGSAPILLSNFGTNGAVNLCQNSSVMVAPIVSGGNAPYTYTWNTWTATCPGQDCPSLTLSAGQFVPGRMLTLRVKDAAGCFADASALLVSGDQGWLATSFYTGYQQQPVESSSDFNNADVVTESIGNPYYVGIDNKVWRYRFASTQTFVGWVNEPVTTAADASGEMAIYEPAAGKWTIYYRTNGNNLIKKVTWDGFEGLLPQSSCGGALKVDQNGVPVYRNLTNQLVKQITSNPELIPNSALLGRNFALTGSKIYFVNPAGLLTCIDYNGNVFPINSPSGYALNVAPNTDIELNAARTEVYFVRSTGQLAYVHTASNTLQEPIWATSPACNGTFSINQQTGVIYYKGTDNLFYQLFKPTSTLWQVNQLVSPNRLGDVGQSGDIRFRNPNLFYVNTAGYLRLVLYPTNVCNPAVLRQAEPGNVVAISSNESTSLHISPHPVEGPAIVEYTIDEEGEALLEVYDLSGREVLQIPASNSGVGQWKEELNLGQLPQGLYILHLAINGQRRSSTKFSVR